MFTHLDLAELAGISRQAVVRKIQKAGATPARMFSDKKGGRPERYYNDDILNLFPQIEVEKAKEYLREKSRLLIGFDYTRSYRIEVIEDVDEDLDEDSEWGFECYAKNDEEAEAELREALAQPNIIAARLEITTSRFSNWLIK